VPAPTGVRMTDVLTCEVIPYSRFLEFQAGRHRVAAPVVERERPTTIDVGVVSEPAAAERPQAPNGSQH
jgi:hypothetical protein